MEEASEASSRRSSTVSTEPCDEEAHAGVDLSSQLREEMRRRKSRGRERPPPLTMALGQQPSFTPWSDSDGDSYESPRVVAYPLTPVKEQGETPYRIVGHEPRKDRASPP